MAYVPTKKVRVKETGAEAIVNAEDFRADLHEEIEHSDHEFRSRADSASTVEEVDAITSEIEMAETEGGTKPRKASKDGEDLKAKLAARREILANERGPRFLPDAPPPQFVQPKAVQYVPYMAPPSPGVALRSVGVDPVKVFEAAEATKGPATTTTVTPSALDDTRNPKGMGTDVSALAGTARGTGNPGGAAPTDTAGKDVGAERARANEREEAGKASTRAGRAAAAKRKK